MLVLDGEVGGKLFTLTEKAKKSCLTSFCMFAMHLPILLMDGMLLALTISTLDPVETWHGLND